MKKVVSFSLWGNDPIYTVGALRNAELVTKVYPGWESWLYLQDDCRYDLQLKLSAGFDKIIYYAPEIGCDGAFQRFQPFAHPDVSIFVSRDCDSRVSDREFQAVLKWEKSSYQFHCMRDHTAHSYPPVLAGMWGAKSKGFTNPELFLEVLSNYKGAKYFDDQKGLEAFYRVNQDLFIEHDDWCRYKGVKFPKHKPVEFGSFVGERITPYDKPGRV